MSNLQSPRSAPVPSAARPNKGLTIALAVAVVTSCLAVLQWVLLATMSTRSVYSWAVPPLATFVAACFWLSFVLRKKAVDAAPR